ncbi:flagellar basal body-associated FliL family protein [Ferruginibacter profundus]
MKIEQLLVQHFYITKQVTLQGIGTFTLSPDFVMPAETEKDIVLPENAVSFQYNPKATEDESLINYIVQQSRKMRPLASADLESYLMLASQFLNIGKPLKIEGIGMLEKNQLGEYQFSQGQYINTRVEDAEVKLKEKAEENVSFGNESKPAATNKKLVAIIAAVLIVGAIGWAVWYFLSNKKSAAPVAENTTEQVPPPVTPAADTTKKDTTALVQHKPDSIAPAITNAPGTFKVVIKKYPSLLLAQNAYNRLTKYGYKLEVYTADSVTYKLAMPMALPLTDTIHAKDSVRILFGGKPSIDIK